MVCVKRLGLLLLLALVAGPVALVGTPEESYAADGADCTRLTPRQAVRTAQQSAAVFEGQVTLPKHVNPDKPLRLAVQVLAAWTSGVAVPSQTTVTVQPGACRDWTLAHRSPEDYLFFADRGTGTWVVPGDAPRMTARTSRIVSALGQPVAGSEPPAPVDGAESVSFVDQHAAPPRSFTKVAAPGIALLIVGVLGLLVVGRLGRRA